MGQTNDVESDQKMRHLRLSSPLIIPPHRNRNPKLNPHPYSTTTTASPHLHSPEPFFPPCMCVCACVFVCVFLCLCTIVGMLCYLHDRVVCVCVCIFVLMYKQLRSTKFNCSN